MECGRVCELGWGRINLQAIVASSAVDASQRCGREDTEKQRPEPERATEQPAGFNGLLLLRAEETKNDDRATLRQQPLLSGLQGVPQCPWRRMEIPAMTAADAVLLDCFDAIRANPSTTLCGSEHTDAPNAVARASSRDGLTRPLRRAA